MIEVYKYLRLMLQIIGSVILVLPAVQAVVVVVLYWPLRFHTFDIIRVTLEQLHWLK